MSVFKLPRIYAATNALFLRKGKKSGAKAAVLRAKVRHKVHKKSNSPQNYRNFCLICNNFYALFT